MSRISPLLLISSPRLVLDGPLSLQLQALSLWCQSCHHLAATLFQGLGYAARSLQMVMQGSSTHGELPNSCLCALLSASVNSQGKRVEAVQDPCAILHSVIVSPGLEPGEGCSPAWDPASGGWLPTMQSLSPEWSWCLPSMWDKERAQEAKRPSIQESKRATAKSVSSFSPYI